jgi:O-antigen/teichoic acid export membrane protein
MVWTVSFLFLSGLCEFVLVALGRQAFVSAAWVCCLVLNVLLDVALVPRYGAAGAGAGMLVSYAAMSLLLVVAVSRGLGAARVAAAVPGPLAALGALLAVVHVLRGATLLDHAFAALCGTVVFAACVFATRGLRISELKRVRALARERGAPDAAQDGAHECETRRQHKA